MKKSFKMTDLDCAHCAAKMEDGINKLDGVISAKISFMAQRITIEAADESFHDVLESAAKVVKKIEPDCRIIF